MELYGSEVAPEYDLSKITTNIHILYGTNDKIASVQVSLKMVLQPHGAVSMVRRSILSILMNLINFAISEYTNAGEKTAL